MKLGLGTQGASVATHLVGRSELDEDGGPLVPDDDEADAGLHHQVQAHLPGGVGDMVALVPVDHDAVLFLQLQLCPLQSEREGPSSACAKVP